MKVSRKVVTPLVLLASLGLAGCPDDGPAEEAGETVDEAVEDAGEAVEDAVDDIEDAAK